MAKKLKEVFSRSASAFGGESEYLLKAKFLKDIHQSSTEEKLYFPDLMTELLDEVRGQLMVPKENPKHIPATQKQVILPK